MLVPLRNFGVHGELLLDYILNLLMGPRVHVLLARSKEDPEKCDVVVVLGVTEQPPRDDLLRENLVRMHDRHLDLFRQQRERITVTQAARDRRQLDAAMRDRQTELVTRTGQFREASCVRHRLERDQVFTRLDPLDSNRNLGLVVADRQTQRLRVNRNAARGRLRGLTHLPYKSQPSIRSRGTLKRTRQ